MKMKKTVLAMTAAVAATVGFAGDSAPFLLDTVTTSTSSAVDSLAISWDASWIGGDAGATVVIADNGTEVKRTAGVGEFTHALSGIGLHLLTYTTYIGGVAQEEVYTVEVRLTKDIASESVVKTCAPDSCVYSGAANRPAVLVKDMERPPNLNVAAYAPGDVDGDGLLSTNDVLLVQRYNAYQTLSDEMKERFSSYNLTGSALAAADVNGDGVVDADDVTVLVGKFDGYEMVEGTDYTLAYSDNVNAGTGSVTITGIGNYTGTAALSFTIAEATIGADGEPGGGTMPAGGISKYDTACVYDGLPHTVDTNALAALRIGGIAPTIAYSPDGIGGWQAEPLLFTNACTTSIWYRLQVPNYAAYLHEARLTIEPKPIDDETVVKTFSYDSASGTGPEFSFRDPDVFRWQFVAPHSAGDVDGDGVLTDGDVERIDQYLGYLELDESIKPLFEEFNLTGSALAAADYNGDGVVDDSDADELEASFYTLVEGVDYDVDVGYNVVTVTGIGNYTGIVKEVFRSAEIRNVTAKQRWPWNGKVDITYEVMGDIAAGSPPDRMPGLLLLSATNHASGVIGVADSTNVALTVTGNAGIVNTPSAETSTSLSSLPSL